ncbi:hypothetical protein [Enterococcus mundtii]|uniref:Uncharacterized protein n=2 Tax=Enterococcus mundtii TaxID=53346 RepID=A0A1L8USE1_ENTMU|nr:hypothetical protein [Enterococcus mundtii]GEN19120.1 hypothetical protein LAC02_24010 [Ligilactobacillus acidipiscis]AUB53338.1 hypothetical protein EM4838_10135 [Enterococcus mundtii]MZZ59801.1 hypothetical protein [Enterococcus mundtii]MZZ62795.1 hypothetical protein [Enterococcus mundtii]MZZ69879.1 hypothetical protein [Enterococcus mundtii]
MGISQRIRNIFSQTQESTLLSENQQTSFNEFEKTVKEEIDKILKRQIPEGDWSSKEAAIIRLQQAEKIAINCKNNGQNELTTQITKYYEKNFYLSDYIHLWLGIDKEKLEQFQQQKNRTVDANVDASVLTNLVQSLEETIVIRRGILDFCLKNPDYNRLLNDETREEVSARAKPNFFMLDPMIQAYLTDIDKKVATTPPMNAQEASSSNFSSESVSEKKDRLEQEHIARRLGVFETVMVKNRKMTIIEKTKEPQELGIVSSKDNHSQKNQLSSVLDASKNSARQKNKKAIIIANRKVTIYQKKQKSMNNRRRFVFIRNQLRKLNFRNRKKISFLKQQAKASKKVRSRRTDYFNYLR